MKKVFVTIIILSLFLSACGREPEPTVAATEPSAAATVPSTESSGTTEPGETDPSDNCATPGFDAAEYDAYLQQFTADKVPENFVHYEHIRWIGELEYFGCPFYVESEAYDESFKLYLYYLHDEYDCRLLLTISKEGFRDRINGQPTSAVNLADLRCLTEESEGRTYYTHGDLNYLYNDGKISSVLWRSNGLTFELYEEESGIVGYPAEYTDSFMGELLCAETANEALEKFLTAINAPIPET
ncbi:MAG: hypothetical protein IJV82_01565 [Oscillospiraceae bacterium]|nr:hypothetical protein [Oscillospiraceae bacterium]